MDKERLLILGVTASGKGRLAFDLARQTGGEIISVDSMKVYRRMDIGTAKPPKEALESVKYHLIDVVEPSEAFSVGLFLDMAEEAIGQITGLNKPVIAVGGTALYIKALLYGLFEGPGSDSKIRQKLQQRAQVEGTEELYRQLEKVDSAAAQRIHPNDTKRIVRALEVYELTGRPISSLQRQFSVEKPREKWTIIGLQREKAVESVRINSRAKKMIDAGLVDEVKGLLAEERPLSKQARCAIGYAEIIDYLNGKSSLEDAVELIKKNTRHLAKGQRTWFKTFRDINWLDVEADETAEETFSRANALLKI
jgi:tRNA dimethylallyltransferase